MNLFFQIKRKNFLINKAFSYFNLKTSSFINIVVIKNGQLYDEISFT